MRSFENVLEQALAQVFEGQPVDVDITFEEIAAAWTRLGLRKSDLHEVIHAMVEQECLIARNLAGSLGFVLTERGAQRFTTRRHGQQQLQSWLKQRREIQPQDSRLDPVDGNLEPCVLQ